MESPKPGASSEAKTSKKSLIQVWMLTATRQKEKTYAYRRTMQQQVIMCYDKSQIQMQIKCHLRFTSARFMALDAQFATAPKCLMVNTNYGRWTRYGNVQLKLFFLYYFKNLTEIWGYDVQLFALWPHVWQKLH